MELARQTRRTEIEERISGDAGQQVPQGDGGCIQVRRVRHQLKRAVWVGQA